MKTPSRDESHKMGEKEYCDYLKVERRLYSWCLVTYGGVEKLTADTMANDFYKYEPPEALFRDLVFHDLSWNWALLKIHGDSFWKSRPDLKMPSTEYLRESERLFSLVDTLL